MTAAAVLALAGCGSPDVTTQPGATRTLKLSDRTIELRTLYEDDFSNPSDDWVVEGVCPVAVREGRLFFDATAATPQVLTVWCRRPFEGDQVVEYVARVEPGPGNTNLNFFLFGTNPDGSDVLSTSAQRTGKYSEYHRLNNYIVTYLNMDDAGEQDVKAADPAKLRVRVRFRLDPGFNMVHETWRDEPIVKGRDYHFAVVIQGPKIALYVDGEKVFEHADATHRSGHHGFRTWATNASADVFRVSRIVNGQSME